MSSFNAPLIGITLLPHDNSDNLSLVNAEGYTVVVRTEDWKGIDYGIYVPVDAVVDTVNPAFMWLRDKAKPDGTYRVRAIRLRGVFSMGLLVPVPALYDGPMELGTDFADILGIKKYEEPEVIGRQSTDTDTAPAPLGNTAKYTDIDHLRRFGDSQFRLGELVIMTEKVHGANARYLWEGGNVHTGSRNQWKKHEARSPWFQALTIQMMRLIEDIRPSILMGEVYGKGIQDLWYGEETPRFIAFDIYDPRSGYWNYLDFLEKCKEFGVPHVPVLYTGAHSQTIANELAEQDSVVSRITQLSEGVVVRPFFERRSHNIGRVILKQPSQRYLLRGDK